MLLAALYWLWEQLEETQDTSPIENLPTLAMQILLWSVLPIYSD